MRYLFGFLGAVVAYLFGALAERGQKKGRRDSKGWKTLYPSWLMHVNLVGTTALSAFFLMFILNGGSARSDAATQNFIAVIALVFMCLLVAYLGWNYYLRTIAWRGGKLRIRSPLGRERLRKYSEIMGVEELTIRGEYRIRFTDGSSLVFSKYAHGAKEFVARLPKDDFLDSW